jgi:hypothetical protein
VRVGAAAGLRRFAESVEPEPTRISALHAPR